MSKIVMGGVEGRRKVSKVVHFGGLRGMVPGALLRRFRSRSIFGVRASFLRRIEEECKEMPKRKWISESDIFKGLLFALKSTVKSQNLRRDGFVPIGGPRTGRQKFFERQ